MTPKCDVPAGEEDELSAWHTLALSKCVLTASVAPCREGCAADLRSFIISPSFVQRPRAPSLSLVFSPPRLSLVSFSQKTGPTLLSPYLDLCLSTFSLVIPRYPLICAALLPFTSVFSNFILFHCLPFSACISLSFTHSKFLSLSLSLSLAASSHTHTHTHCRHTKQLSRDEGETEKWSPRVLSLQTTNEHVRSDACEQPGSLAETHTQRRERESERKRERERERERERKRER